MIERAMHPIDNCSVSDQGSTYQVCVSDVFYHFLRDDGNIKTCIPAQLQTRPLLF